MGTMEKGDSDKASADATHRSGGLASSIAGAIGWFGGSPLLGPLWASTISPRWHQM